MDNGALLLKIDEAAPERDLAVVGYRYPFVVNTEYVAPISFDGWENHLGNAMGVQASVGRLISAVKDECRVFGRAPR